MKRRQFFKSSAGLCLLAGAGLPPFPDTLRASGERKPNLSFVEARYYKKLPDREIECFLCPRLCRLGDRERGYCGVRENRDGTYYTLVYGKACILNVDPVEKKPFFHFLPGTNSLSIAAAGCNVNCKFCQNWQISQVRPEQVEHFDLPPDEVVESAQKYGCPTISYTYTEPVVFFEYMVDTSVKARKKGIRNLVVTGGHICREPLKELIHVVDAIKIDLKAFSQDFYTQYVRGELKPVIEAIQTVAGSGIWMEIVYLVIPNLNDGPDEIRKLCRWLAGEVGPDVPVHFSRFFPMYLMKNLPPTPLSTLEKTRRIALEEGLRYVYIGNVPGHESESTFCPGCGKKIILRTGFQIRRMELEEGLCRYCHTPIPGIWA